MKDSTVQNEHVGEARNRHSFSVTTQIHVQYKQTTCNATIHTRGSLGLAFEFDNEWFVSIPRVNMNLALKQMVFHGIESKQSGLHSIHVVTKIQYSVKHTSRSTANSVTVERC